MHAVIKTGGKQYRVAVGDVVDIEKTVAEPGSAIAFDEVLLISSEESVEVGRPVVSGARVLGEVVDQVKDTKVTIFKHKKRKNYRRTNGHRQPLTRVLIKEITLQ
jgi:large subunit ribosomal protein L21